MPAIMFHAFHGDGHPKVQGSLSASQLRYIIETRKPVGAAEWTPESDRDVLTFDDGLLSQRDIALPVLRAYGLTAFFFVYTAPLCGVLSRLEYYRRVRTTLYPTIDAFYDAWDAATGGKHTAIYPPDYLAAHTYLSDRDRQFRYWRDHWVTREKYEAVMDALVADLERQGKTVPLTLWMQSEDLVRVADEGHVVGSHSHSHPTVMEGLTKEAQEVEYSTSSWILFRLLGRRPHTMAHPCNQYTPHGLAYLRQLGYTLGFRATPEAGDWGPLEVPRIDCADLVRGGPKT
jgi:peptidoglycan/xylan/chitin deacetylase (PgdA/CDA1 family)